MNNDTEDTGLRTLHNNYHLYKLRCIGNSESPLNYEEWLEETALRLAELVGELEIERDNFQHAAETNHGYYVQERDLRTRFEATLNSVRFMAQMRNFDDIWLMLVNAALWN